MTDTPETRPPPRLGTAVADLADVMRRLRAECEWDREQTLKTLRSYLLEETHEVLDVLDRLDEHGGGPAASEHQSELGDLLLQIVFQSEIQREAGRFDLDDVARGINAKLVRRHPHIFGGGEKVAWEKLKQLERDNKATDNASPDTASTPSKSALDGVPKHLPALLRAYRTGEKAHGVGFDWPDHHGVLAKIEEELRELEETLEPFDRGRFEDEVGDLLYAIVNLCRHQEVDPEAALRRTIGRFEARFRHVERSMVQDGKDPYHSTLDELEAYWTKAKRALIGA